MLESIIGFIPIALIIGFVVWLRTRTEEQQTKEPPSPAQEEETQSPAHDDAEDDCTCAEEAGEEEIDEEYEEDEKQELEFTKEEVIRVLEMMCATKQVSRGLLKEILSTTSKADAMMEFLQQNDLLLAMVEEGKWEADVKKIKQLLGQPASAASSHNGSLALEDSSCAGVHEPATPYPGPKAMKSSTKWIIAGVVIFASFILMSLFILIAGELLSDGLDATATILFSVLLWLPMILSSLACFIIGFLKMGNNK